MGEQWRTVKVALRSVRPFLFESVRLDQCLAAPLCCLLHMFQVVIVHDLVIYTKAV